MTSVELHSVSESCCLISNYRFDEQRSTRNGKRDAALGGDGLPVHAEGIGQGADLCFREGPGDGGVQLDSVEAVVGARHYLEAAPNAGLLQPPGIGDVLLMKQIVRPDADPERWTEF